MSPLRLPKWWYETVARKRNETISETTVVAIKFVSKNANFTKKMQTEEESVFCVCVALMEG